MLCRKRRRFATLILSASMELKGKLFCGLAGLFVGDLTGMPIGGLIGFFTGSVIGHYMFDSPKEISAEQGAYQAYQRRQGQFVFHVFRLCAKMAKADGAINRAEVNHMERLITHQFRLTERGRSQAIRVWKQSKEGSDAFDILAREFYNEFSKERHQILNMIDLLFAMAASDGGLHPREEELLLRASGIFHIGRLQYDRIKSRYYSQAKTQRQAAYSPMDPYFTILGATPEEPLDSIKKKYRNLAMQWHPDKIAAKGASPDAMRHAKEKFQQITEAWEKIEALKKQ
jgi:DnaJ like chaperone protein